ncbi:MAG TPA: MFS transporter [Pirellulaceae bacterium]|nr:MFS transporter [Pirellulaceae bacterium]
MTTADPPPRAKLPRNVWLLGFASLLNDIASEMIYPLLPHFLLAVLGGSKQFLGIIEGAAESLASLLKLFAGAWSDRARQRKSLAVAGYAIAALVRPLFGLATAPWHALSLRLADRFGKGIRTAPRDALIADSTDATVRGRAFGLHRGMDHLGAAIGPLMAMIFLWLWPAHLRTMFVLTLIPGLAVVALLIFGLREPPRAAPATQEPLEWTLRPFGANFRVFLAALVLFTLGNSSDAFLLVRAGELGVPQHLLPLLWFAFHVVKSSGNMAGGALVDRAGPRLPLAAGWLAYAAIYLGFAFASSVWHVWTLFLGYGIYYALAEPAEKTLVAQLAGPQHKGLAFGWYNLAIGIGALPASVIFGILYQQFGPVVAFGSGAGLAVGAVALLIFVRATRDTETMHV